MTDIKPSTTAERSARVAQGFGAAVGAFLIGTLGLSVAVYATGGEFTVPSVVADDPMTMLNLTGTAALGMATMVIGLTVGLFSMVAAIGAAVVGIGVAALGVVGALLVTVGVVTGPVLLIAVLVILAKRRYYPDVI